MSDLQISLKKTACSGYNENDPAMSRVVRRSSPAATGNSTIAVRFGDTAPGHFFTTGGSWFRLPPPPGSWHLTTSVGHGPPDNFPAPLKNYQRAFTEDFFCRTGHPEDFGGGNFGRTGPVTTSHSPLTTTRGGGGRQLPRGSYGGKNMLAGPIKRQCRTNPFFPIELGRER